MSENRLVNFSKQFYKKNNRLPTVQEKMDFVSSGQTFNINEPDEMNEPAVGRELYPQNEKVLGLGTPIVPKDKRIASIEDADVIQTLGSPNLYGMVEPFQQIPFSSENTTDLVTSNLQKQEQQPEPKRLVSTTKPVLTSNAKDVKEISNSQLPTDRDVEMEAAQEAARKNTLMSQLLLAAQGVGQGLIQTTGADAKFSDSPIVKNLMESADSPITDLKSKREQYEVMLKNKELKDMSDPNSDISRAARDLVKSMGASVEDGATAMQLNKMIPYLQQKYAVEESRKNRIEAAKERAMAAGDRDFARKLEVMKRWEDKVIGTDSYKLLQSIRDSENTIDQYMAQPQAVKNNPYAAFQTIMGTLKPLQGDTSVMRESDLAVFMKKFGTFQNAEEAIKNIGGDTVITSPKFLQLAKRALTVARQAREKTLKPYAEQVQKLGAIDPRLNDYMNESLSNITKTGTSDSKTFPKQVRKDGKVATVSNQSELDEALSEGWE